MMRLSCTYVDDSGALFTIQELRPCACQHMTEVKVFDYIGEDVRYHHVVVSSGPKPFVYITKVVVQCLQLLWVLLRMELQSHLLMQVLEERRR